MPVSNPANWNGGSGDLSDPDNWGAQSDPNNPTAPDASYVVFIDGFGIVLNGTLVVSQANLSGNIDLEGSIKGERRWVIRRPSDLT